MKYSIIDTKKGEDYDINPVLHRTISDGTKMVVNENELLLVNEDINIAADILGGEVLSQAEVYNRINMILHE